MRPKFCDNQVRPIQFCQVPVTTSGKKKEENWSERFSLKVYFVVSYFSLIIFSTVELTSFALAIIIIVIIIIIIIVIIIIIIVVVIIIDIITTIIIVIIIIIINIVVVVVNIPNLNYIGKP